VRKQESRLLLQTSMRRVLERGRGILGPQGLPSIAREEGYFRGNFSHSSQRMNSKSP